ncbi:2658_t:CDS:2 [Acaulospora colombiana]|uniref:2658_t:CDS:1 n=1 Tax=Acaulospora colombiana TaxID=27376 RepID=A0ACA9KN19_9GLOM|nr:2658_t:CDS:2 [Acaulospora colombiana]
MPKIPFHILSQIVVKIVKIREKVTVKHPTNRKDRDQVSEEPNENGDRQKCAAIVLTGEFKGLCADCDYLIYATEDLKTKTEDANVWRKTLPLGIMSWVNYANDLMAQIDIKIRHVNQNLLEERSG